MKNKEEKKNEEMEEKKTSVNNNQKDETTPQVKKKKKFRLSLSLPLSTISQKSSLFDTPIKHTNIFRKHKT